MDRTPNPCSMLQIIFYYILWNFWIFRLGDFNASGLRKQLHMQLNFRCYIDSNCTALYYILNLTANSTILITQVPKVLNNNTKTPLKTVTPELQCGSVNSPHSTMAFHREVNFGLVLHTLKSFNKLHSKFCFDAQYFNVHSESFNQYFHCISNFHL